jgi:thioredoxin 1
MTTGTFEVTGDNFATDVLGAALPVLVEFGADWCPPCKMLAPHVAAIAHTYAGQLRVGELDADDYPDLVQQYQVMGLPTLLLFVKGQLVKRMTGYQPRERLEAQIRPFLQTVDTPAQP